jgi:hypothetical protein
MAPHLTRKDKKVKEKINRKSNDFVNNNSKLPNEPSL